MFWRNYAKRDNFIFSQRVSLQTQENSVYATFYDKVKTMISSTSISKTKIIYTHTYKHTNERKITGKYTENKKTGNIKVSKNIVSIK